MRRVILITICIMVMVNLAACSGSSDVAAIKSPVYPKGISFDDYDGWRDIRDKNQVDEGYMKVLNNFSYSSASMILSGQSKNTSYSPISLYMTLSLAGSGAKGATRDEIYSVLGVGDKGTDFISRQNGNLFRVLYSDNEVGKLKIANSLWLKKGINFKDDFINNGVENYYASLYNVDFSDNNTAQLMGKWISDNTNGVLNPKISLNNEQIMSIINTLYFKDEWVDRFDENNTKPDTFYLSDGDKIECDFMNMTFQTHGYMKGDGFTSSSLGLKNNGSMTFILPDKGVGVNELLSTPEKIAALFETNGDESGKVVFKIPKFSSGNELDLIDTLKDMGIVSAFKQDADFSGITEGMAFISNIKQQTHVAIDEKGVEAAAFTQIDYCGSAPPNEKIAEMILDRPFIYAITANNGAILFIGIVNNPLEK